MVRQFFAASRSICLASRSLVGPPACRTQWPWRRNLLLHSRGASSRLIALLINRWCVAPGFPSPLVRDHLNFHRGGNCAVTWVRGAMKIILGIQCKKILAPWRQPIVFFTACYFGRGRHTQRLLCFGQRCGRWLHAPRDERIPDRVDGGFN